MKNHILTIVTIILLVAIISLIPSSGPIALIILVPLLIITAIEGYKEIYAFYQERSKPNDH